MRLLALTETADHVCGRYRIRAFQRALNASDWSLTIQGIEKGLVARLRQIDRARDFDAVILQRKLLPSWQIGLLRRRAERLLFDFDDAVLYRDSYDSRGPNCPRRASRFRTLMRSVDGVIAGNDFLAECAIRSGATVRAVRVIPTCIATESYPVATHEENGGIELAWIGSSSTLAGLEVRNDLWNRIGEDVAGVRLRLICDRFPIFESMPVVPIPWSETTEAVELAKAGAGVSWIPDDLWSKGKCGLKILQYQAAGLPAIANPVGVHPEMIQNGVSGFLPTTPEQWIEAIRSLRDDPSRRLEMGRAARLSVEERYSVSAWSSMFVGMISGNAAPPAPKSRVSRDGAASRETGSSTR